MGDWGLFPPFSTDSSRPQGYGMVDQMTVLLAYLLICEIQQNTNIAHMALVRTQLNPTRGIAASKG